MKKTILLGVLISFNSIAQSTIYVDAGTGNDNLGTGEVSAPYKTIEHGLRQANSGDSIILMPGTYRESVVINKNNITFRANGPGVVVDGTEEIQLQPVPGTNRKYAQLTPDQIPASGQVEQVFNAAKNLSYWEARWPNLKPEDLWPNVRNQNSGWASVTNGTGVSDGTRAVVNYAGDGIGNIGPEEELYMIYNGFSQFRTFAKKVNYQPLSGGFRLLYELDSRCELDSVEISPCGQKNNPDWWIDDYFYVFGNQKLLDAAGEWFFDNATDRLEVIPVDGSNTVHVKVRPFAFSIEGAERVYFDGIKFLGTAIRSLTSEGRVSSKIGVNNCHFLYPSWDRMLNDNSRGEAKYKKNDPMTDGIHMVGDEIVFTNNLVEKGGTYGIYIDGVSALVVNNIVRDIDWFGNLEHAPIMVLNNKNLNIPNQSKILNNTVYNFGNVGIRFFGAGIEVGYNNVFNGGLLSLDTALIYTARPTGAGSRIHHNFAHNGTGIGVRLDGFSVTGMTVDHNVVWNVRRGMKISGYNNIVLNNTIDVDNAEYSLLLEWGPEQRGLERPGNQNRSTIVQNNLAYRIHYRDRGSVNSNKVLVGELYNNAPSNNPIQRLNKCEKE